MIAFKNQKSGLKIPDVELWRLTKNKRSLVCFARSTQLGPEILVLLDGDLLRSELCRPPTDSGEVARDLRRGAERNGWA